MVKNLLRKCLLVTCIFITLCPKRGRFVSEEEITKKTNNDNKNNMNHLNLYLRKNKKNLNNHKTTINRKIKTNDNNNNNIHNNNNNNNKNNNNGKTKIYTHNNDNNNYNGNVIINNNDNNNNNSNNNDNNNDNNNVSNNNNNNIHNNNNNNDKNNNNGKSKIYTHNNDNNNYNDSVIINNNDNNYNNSNKKLYTYYNENINDKDNDNDDGNDSDNDNDNDNANANTNDDDNDNYMDNDNGDDNDIYINNNNNNNDSNNNNDNNSDSDDIFVKIHDHDDIDETEKLKATVAGSEEDKEKKNKLKDVLKDASVTLWTGLKNAEPGFDLDANEMEKFNIWPRGDIPYYIDEYSFDPTLQTRIRDVLVAVNSVTGLNFNELRNPPIDDKTRFVFFINRRGILPCVDYTNKNFTNVGVQKVVLGYDCLSIYKSLGSLILALAGVPPQHNSPDRDQHIHLQMENILPDKTHLFEKIPDTEWLFHDIDYDYYSAGHYDLLKYTANGKATIKLSVQDVTSLGDEGLSYGDLWKIRMLYNYISRNRATIGKSECSKLFVPGSKFQKYRPDSGEDITPRKKPNKYLGIPDEKPPKTEKASAENNPGKEEDYKEKTDNDEHSAEIPNQMNYSHDGNHESTENEDKIFRTHKRT